MFELRETDDWDIFLGPQERARAEIGGADQWVLKRGELSGFARVNEVNSASLGYPLSVFKNNSDKFPNSNDYWNRSTLQKYFPLFLYCICDTRILSCSPGGCTRAENASNPRRNSNHRLRARVEEGTVNIHGVWGALGKKRLGEKIPKLSGPSISQRFSQIAFLIFLITGGVMVFYRLAQNIFPQRKGKPRSRPISKSGSTSGLPRTRAQQENADYGQAQKSKLWNAPTCVEWNQNFEPSAAAHLRESARAFVYPYSFSLRSISSVALFTG